MSTAYQAIQFETADGVCTITLNRPDSLNSINDAMTEELQSVFTSLQTDAEVRCVILTGAGRAFCSGQDLGDLKSKYADPSFKPHLGDDLRRRYNPVITALHKLEKPVIAAVNGVAAGAGLGFALACDLRIASEKASFIEVFINVGLVPDSGNTFFLPRMVGLGKAMELCFTGDKVAASEALQLGLVNKVVPPEQLMVAARDLATRLSRLPTTGIALTKRLLLQSSSSKLDDMLEAEAVAQEKAAHTADHKEGVRAFFEKRPAKFQGQ